MNPSTEIETKKNHPLIEFFQEKKENIEKLLPSDCGLSAEALMTSVFYQLNSVPKLKECSRDSLLNCVRNAATLGLIPGSPSGFCYFNPFKKNTKNPQTGEWSSAYEAQFILGYKGARELCYRSKDVINIYAEAVYENDSFEVIDGFNRDLRHSKAEHNRGEFRAAYCVVHLSNGHRTFGYMYREEIDKYARRSTSYDRKTNTWKGPWGKQEDYPEMAKKTVFLNMTKYLPMSIQNQKIFNEEQMSDISFDAIEGEIEDQRTQKRQTLDEIASSLSEKNKEIETIANISSRDEETTVIVSETPSEEAKHDCPDYNKFLELILDSGTTQELASLSDDLKKLDLPEEYKRELRAAYAHQLKNLKKAHTND